MRKLTDITFHLCDLNSTLVEEWTAFFGDYVNFKIYHRDLFGVYEEIKKLDEEVAIVSPANSFGELSGGIDKLYLHYFGYQLEEEIQNRILNEYHGEVVVGNAFIDLLPDYSKGYFIVAPTMRVPMNIAGTMNAYLAFRAVLVVLDSNNIKHVIVPGLGTGIGKLPPDICARQMHHAYHKMINPDRHLDLLVATQEYLGLI